MNIPSGFLAALVQALPYTFLAALASSSLASAQFAPAASKAQAFPDIRAGEPRQLVVDPYTGEYIAARMQPVTSGPGGSLSFFLDMAAGPPNATGSAATWRGIGAEPFTKSDRARIHGIIPTADSAYILCGFEDSDSSEAGTYITRYLRGPFWPAQWVSQLTSGIPGTSLAPKDSATDGETLYVLARVQSPSSSATLPFVAALASDGSVLWARVLHTGAVWLSRISYLAGSLYLTGTEASGASRPKPVALRLTKAGGLGAAVRYDSLSTSELGRQPPILGFKGSKFPSLIAWNENLDLAIVPLWPSSLLPSGSVRTISMPGGQSFLRDAAIAKTGRMHLLMAPGDGSSDDFLRILVTGATPFSAPTREYSPFGATSPLQPVLVEGGSLVAVAGADPAPAPVPGLLVQHSDAAGDGYGCANESVRHEAVGPAVQASALEFSLLGVNASLLEFPVTGVTLNNNFLGASTVCD